METRTLTQIRRELQDASERRTELWHELSLAADPEKTAEISRLNDHIEALWTEARAVKSRERFGDPASIIKRARAEERLERDFQKVA